MFVNAPYDRYVTAGTRFWNASGIDVTVGADGVDVQTRVAGGAARQVASPLTPPPFIPPAAPAAADTTFTLYKDRAAAMKAPDPVAQTLRRSISTSRCAVFPSARP